MRATGERSTCKDTTNGTCEKVNYERGTAGKKKRKLSRCGTKSANEKPKRKKMTGQKQNRTKIIRRKKKTRGIRSRGRKKK